MLFGAGSVEEAGFAQDDWTGGIDKFTPDSTKDGVGLQEAERAGCDYGADASDGTGAGLLIQPEGTDSTLFVTLRMWKERARSAGKSILFDFGHSQAEPLAGGERL